jgi:hypothetical protein
MPAKKVEVEVIEKGKLHVHVPESVDPEMLLQRIAELEAQLAQKAEEPVPPKAEEEDVITFENGAQYKAVGNCAKCGIKVYDLITKTAFPEGIGNRVVTYVPNARAPHVKGEPPPPEPTSTKYCFRCDPYYHLRFGKGRPRVEGQAIPQSEWQPIDGPGRM